MPGLFLLFLGVILMSKKNIKVQFFRQPRYFNDFQCMGGSCPVSCCTGWCVDWTEKEMEKLKNVECSEHLKELIDNSFGENGEKYMIKMDQKLRCPFLTEDNFCAIQRELGEEYLSYTCAVYPRNVLISGNTFMNYCHLSCYRILDTLCNNKDCMVLENYKCVNKRAGKADADNNEDLLKHPELKYRQQLFEFFYEIISDESRSLETSITLGAVAAQNLARSISSGAADLIPQRIASLANAIKDPKQVEKLENLKPNYAVKLGFAKRLNEIVLKSNLIDLISENGAIISDKYDEGISNFNDAFAEKPFALRNIALNLLLELKMPFRVKDIGIFENYCYYIAAIASVKFVAAVSYNIQKSNPEKMFKRTAAYISRFFAHNDENVKPIVDLFKELNCMSPAYIALIVK